MHESCQVELVLLPKLALMASFIILTAGHFQASVAESGNQESRHRLRELRRVVDGKPTAEEKRRTVAEHMRKLDDEEFLSLWEEAATSNDLELREFAISAEARKRWDSHPPISKLLKDISDPKRDPALRIDLMRYLQSPNTRRSIIKMQAVEEAISTLVAIARSTEPNAVREAALAASGSIGLHAYEVDELKGKADADLRKVLLAHLEDDKEAGVIRGRAAVLLSRFRDPRAVAPMALAAKDQSLHSAQFLERIASSLGFYDKDSQALEALERLLDNPNVAIRREVIRSLEKIGSPKARRRVDQLQETERDKSVLRLIGELREKRKR